MVDDGTAYLCSLPVARQIDIRCFGENYCKIYILHLIHSVFDVWDVENITIYEFQSA